MSSRDLRSLGNSISVSLPTDERGYTGRECPSEDCLGYFKVTCGTGLTDTDKCVCPYCGTAGEPGDFLTKDQREYAMSVAKQRIVGAIHKDLKSMEFEIKPPRNSMLGIGMSLKVEPHRPLPLHRYAEKKLETEVTCDRCTLKYAIYGVFGHCPDCGVHNNLGIFHANLQLVEKMLTLAVGQDDAGLKSKLIENALEDCVSTFDGWGRATVSAFASCTTNPDNATKISFQNLRRARAAVQAHFGYDLSQPVTDAEFHAAHTVFQKRHLVAHKMGVVDQDYIHSTGDNSTPVGRKVDFDNDEILSAIAVLRTVAEGFLAHLEASA